MKQPATTAPAGVNAQLRGRLLHHEPLAAYTTWRVGGPAEHFYRPADVDDLALFLSGLPVDEPVFWLGLGSNLLVRDGGIPGTVIATTGVLDGIELLDPQRVRVGVGVACNKVARFTVRRGLTGGEFLVGIPGTVGGALAMNAGAWGGETWQLVASVSTIDRQGRRRERGRDQFEVGYREVAIPEAEWFIAAVLKLTPTEEPVEVGLNRIRQLLAERSASQPTGVASAGSVFRNPPGDHAGRLVEASGLKGCCHGGACVSERHGNFIVNTGGATAADIEALIAHCAATVSREQGVTLRPEVRIVGVAG